MKYLFFDIETTGTNSRRDNIVQLAAILTDDTGKEISILDYIIKPDGFRIPIASTRIHGISQDKAMKEGISLQAALSEFIALSNRADYHIAHNIAFDYPFICIAIGKVGLAKEGNSFLNLPPASTYCTMKTTVSFVQLGWNEKYQTYKWPKLVELYFKLFGAKLEGVHNALVDVRATSKCFFELKDKHGFYQ